MLWNWGGVTKNADGSIGHAEVTIGDSKIMLFDLPSNIQCRPTLMNLYVDDCVLLYNRALNAGAISMTRITEHSWGDKSGRIIDPFGNVWWLVSHYEDVSSDEMMKRFSQKKYVEAMEYAQSSFDLRLSTAIGYGGINRIRKGLQSYESIIDKVRTSNDISVDDGFQKCFTRFYRVRRSKSKWLSVYYRYFEDNRNNKNLTFEEVLRFLYEHTNTIEPSFSSKLISTLNPDKPIWDQYVLAFLNKKMKTSYKTDEEKLKACINIYSEIEKWYSDNTTSRVWKERIAEFDRLFPHYTWLTTVKKIDFILWTVRD